MDSIKGAIQLRELLSRLAPDGHDEPTVPAGPIPEDALPIFHWLGVPPPLPTDAQEENADR